MESADGSASAAGPSGMSEAGRIAGVFWEPKPVFADLATHPRWWVPMILVVVLGLVYVAAFSQVVGWRTFMENEIANNSRLQQITAEQREAIVEQQSKIAGVMGYAGAVVGGVVTLLLVAGVLLFGFKLAAGAVDLTFRQALAIVCYAWLPFVLYQGLALIALFNMNPADFDLRNPLPFNIGWFLDPSSTSAGLVSAASSVDLFSFWVIALMALGFSVAVKKVSFGKAFSVVFGAWVVWVLLKAGGAALTG